MANFYVLGNEEETMYGVGGATFGTTANTFRSAPSLSRGSWTCNGNGSTGGLGGFAQNRKLFSASSFYTTGRVGVTGTATSVGSDWFRLFDSNGVLRLRLRATSVATNVVTTVLEKLTAAGVVTQLGSSFTFTVPAVSSSILPPKVDIFVNYAVSGTFSFYVGGNPTAAFTFSGDVTTDSVTSLAQFGFGNPFAGVSAFWSEFACADIPLFSGSVGTIPIGSSNGNTHNFDTGSPTAANVNETILNDLTFDGSTTAGQIDQYTVGTIPSGAWSAPLFRLAGRAAKGSSGPSKLDLGVRLGGTDYWSSDLSLQTYYDLVTADWTVNPATSAQWAGGDFSTAGVNLGAKSVT